MLSASSVSVTRIRSQQVAEKGADLK